MTQIWATCHNSIRSTGQAPRQMHRLRVKRAAANISCNWSSNAICHSQQSHQLPWPYYSRNSWSLSLTCSRAVQTCPSSLRPSCSSTPFTSHFQSLAGNPPPPPLSFLSYDLCQSYGHCPLSLQLSMETMDVMLILTPYEMCNPQIKMEKIDHSACEPTLCFSKHVGNLVTTYHRASFLPTPWLVIWNNSTEISF